MHAINSDFSMNKRASEKMSKLKLTGFHLSCSFTRSFCFHRKALSNLALLSFSGLELGWGKVRCSVMKQPSHSERGGQASFPLCTSSNRTATVAYLILGPHASRPIGVCYSGFVQNCHSITRDMFIFFCCHPWLIF